MKVSQLCPTVCNPMDYTVHGILQTRIMEWVAFPFFRGSSQGLLHCRLSHKGSPRILEWVAYPFPPDLPDPGIEPGSSALQADSLPTELSGKPQVIVTKTHRYGYQNSPVLSTKGHIVSFCGNVFFKKFSPVLVN